MKQNEIVEIVTEAYNYSQKLYNGMDSLINNIDTRNLSDLNDYFKNILDGFNWVLEVVILSNEFNGENLDLNNINEKINKYIEAYNNIDILLVRDIVEYELMPQVEVFYEMFGKYLVKLQNFN